MHIGISNNFFSSQQQITPRGSNTNNFTRETMKISFIRAIFRNSHWIRIGGPAIPRTILELFVNLIYDKPRHVANVCRLLLRPSPSIYNWESKHNVFITDFPTVYLYTRDALSTKLEQASILSIFPPPFFALGLFFSSYQWPVRTISFNYCGEYTQCCSATEEDPIYISLT